MRFWLKKAQSLCLWFKMTIKTFAPAKVNLSLHVTGMTANGYHQLDSMVVMVDVGDHITVQEADDLTLTVSGPFAEGVPSDGSNLVMRAARMLSDTRGAQITLEKNLPPASGIGGGSSDAAATIRALSRLWDIPMPSVRDLSVLGADIPVCMSPFLTRMQGIGDKLDPICAPPDYSILLVNPRVEVSTPDVFNALASKQNSPMSVMPDLMGAHWLDWLRDQRNDLQAPAIELEPVIADVLTCLEADEGTLLARMSGSGATCFAIMKDADDATRLAHDIQSKHPNWWVAKGHTCFQSFI